MMVCAGVNAIEPDKGGISVDEIKRRYCKEAQADKT